MEEWSPTAMEFLPLHTYRRIEGEVARRSQGQRSALRVKILGEGASRKEPWLLGAPALEEGEGVLCASAEREEREK